MSFKNAWKSSTTYAIGDAVSENGSSYIALTANTNIDPATDVAGSGTNWALLAKIGNTGLSGTVSIGATTTGSYGTSALVTNTGTPSASILNFTIPQGVPGPAGPTGPTGPTGPQGPAGTNGSGVNAFNTQISFENPGNDDVNTNYFFNPANIGEGNNSFSPGTHTTFATSSEMNFFVAPATCTMSALNLAVSNVFTATTDTVTVTVYHGSSATSMTASVTVNGNSVSNSDKTHTFSVTAGDSLAVAWKETNPNGFNNNTIQLVCQ